MLKILFCSYPFHPAVGGIEVNSEILAREFSRDDVTIRLVTCTGEGAQSSSAEAFPFEVTRKPSLLDLFRLHRWADVVYQNNLSLRLVWPALILRKRLVVSVRTWVRRKNGRRGLKDRFKLAVLRRANALIYISKAIALDTGLPGEVIGNPYRDTLFRVVRPPDNRPLDVAFVGRLVSDKGTDLLLQAFAELGDAARSLTIIGSGPEGQYLQTLARKLGLGEKVTFAGELAGEELAITLNRHKVIAVPSRWPEPFGNVALEGLACGCVPVVSAAGGLPDAIGECGLSFPNGDVHALAVALRSLLENLDIRQAFLAKTPSHLEKHTTSVVGLRYFDIVRGAARPRPLRRSNLNILFCSYSFSPALGGIETVSALLARAFSEAGHRVKVITQTASPDFIEWPFEVVRSPSPGALISLLDWSDVCFHNNISLSTAWALLLVHRPWIVAHHTWLTRSDGRVGVRDRFKRAILGFADNVTVSRALADSLNTSSRVIPDPFDSAIFRLENEGLRSKELVFLGRLVSDKGLDLLLEALRRLSDLGQTPTLTVIGSGPEEAKLKAHTDTLDLTGQVTFCGPRTGRELAEMLNQHQIMVIPSRWAEPFGIVALEGIACGCLVIGSAKGGLPDAIGQCGLTFQNENVDELTLCLQRALADESLAAKCRAARDVHLAPHEPGRVASAYLNRFSELLE